MRAPVLASMMLMMTPLISVACRSPAPAAPTVGVGHTAPTTRVVEPVAASPVDCVGETSLLKAKGCITCHAIDGTPRIGPPLNGMWMTTRSTSTGEHVADRAYIVEAILSPQTAIATGFQPVMPPYAGQLSEAQVDELIECMKTLP